MAFADTEVEPAVAVTPSEVPPVEATPTEAITENPAEPETQAASEPETEPAPEPKAAGRARTGNATGGQNRNRRPNGRRAAAKDPFASRRGLAPAGRELMTRRPRHRQRHHSHRTWLEGRSRARPYQSRWPAAAASEAYGLYRAAQAQYLGHHRERSAGAHHGDGHAARREGAGVSGGPPRLSQRGLLLFTNDGELANAVMSAATHLPKTYVVKVNGTLTADQEQALPRGRAAFRAAHAAGGPEADSRGGESLVRGEA